MTIELNSLALGEGTTYHISGKIEGLEKPDVRTSSSNYSGRDGGRVNAQYYSPRLITITGFITSDSCDAHESAREALDAALPIRDDIDVVITTPGGSEFVTSASLLALDMPWGNSKFSEYKIDLFCGDPNFYLGGIGAESSITIQRFVGGGLVLPIILPAVFAAGSGVVTAVNGSAVSVYPIITITGSAANPEITNVDTGEKVEVNVTMSSGDVLVIDMKNRTITLNGGSVLSFRSSDSDWFALAPGNNRFMFSTTNGSDAGVAVMTWRTAVGGI